MISVSPLFHLLGRAAAFWIGLFAMGCAGLVITGFANPEARALVPDFDVVFASAVVFPLLAGWIVGALVQEFQHTTFAFPLPDVRSRMTKGFVLVGATVATVVVVWIGLKASGPHNLAVLFVLALGVYCAAGVFLDPFSAWLTTVHAVIAFLLFAVSGRLSRFADAHPWIIVALALAAGAYGVSRLFARSTFRRKPFKATSPFPGRFSLERTQRFETRRRLELGGKRRRWNGSYFGVRPWAWVRAALHQTHGALTLKTFGRSVGKAWGIALLVLVHAWVERGEFSFGQAIVRTLHEALLRSPHVPTFGERGGPLGLVLFVIALAAVLTAMFAPVALRPHMTYPLSRRQRAGIHFRGGLVDAGVFLLLLGPLLLGVGYVSGWIAGYDLRFDFMPFSARVILVTVILMPLGYWGRWQLLQAVGRRDSNSMIGVIAGVLGFCFLVWVGVILSASAFPNPLAELSFLLAVLLMTRWLHLRVLLRHFRRADLV